MGSGIAQVCAAAGYEVALSDADGTVLHNAGETIAARLHRLVERGELEASESSTTLSRLCLREDLTSVEADLAIESVPERMELKKEILSRLDRDLPPEAILVSNTSGLDIGQLATATGRPDRVGVNAATRRVKVFELRTSGCEAVAPSGRSTSEVGSMRSPSSSSIATHLLGILERELRNG